MKILQRITNFYECTNRVFSAFVNSCLFRDSLMAFVFFFLFFGSLTAQNNATMESGGKKNEPSQIIKDNRKVLVIPFNPKLYLSDADQNINRETKMTFNQIRHTFRVGLDFNVFTDIKKTFPSTSLLMLDTVKTKKDIEMIYEGIDYKYDPVPADKNTKVKSDDYNSKSKIENGQLVVKVDETKRFMNTTITNSDLLPYLQKKYGADLYVFINELDIKNEINNSGIAITDNYKRIISVHYTLMDATGQIITGGLATDKFPSNVNIPKEIIAGHFSVVSSIIYDQILTSLGLKPVEKEKPKENNPFKDIKLFKH